MFDVISINDVISITAVHATDLYYEIKMYYGHLRMTLNNKVEKVNMQKCQLH